MSHSHPTVPRENPAAPLGPQPLIEARIAARSITHHLLGSLATPAGVHAESLLAVAGGLAGYAAQVSLRARALQAGGEASAPFHIIRTADGRRFAVGEQLSHVLTADPCSIWRLATADALHAGCGTLPDLGELFRDGIESLGTEQFGRPRVPDRHQPSPMAATCLARSWPMLFAVAREHCPEARGWPVVFAVAAQQVMALTRDVLDPAIALRIVMDSAIARSKVILADN